MRMHEVYRGKEYNATVSTQDDGQKVWTFGAWGDFWVTKEIQALIEAGIDHAPHVGTLRCGSFTIYNRHPAPRRH